MTSHAHNAAPTLSRGRPALPVYRWGVTFSGCYQRVVDNFVAVDNSGVAAHGAPKGPFSTLSSRDGHRRFHAFANDNSGVAR